MLLPSVFEFSSRLPVSVCGTGTYNAIAAFLGSVDFKTSLLNSLRVTLHLSFTDFPIKHDFVLARVFPFLGFYIFLRHYSSDYT